MNIVRCRSEQTVVVGQSGGDSANGGGGHNMAVILCRRLHVLEGASKLLLVFVPGGR